MIYLLAFATALLTVLACVPVIANTAVHRKLLDHPDGGRRRHARAVPRLGGVAVFAGLVVAVGLRKLLTPIVTGQPYELTSMGAATLAGCGILFAIGLVDDLRGVPPLFKILGQSLAAVVVWQAGLQVNTLVFPGGLEISLGWLALPITVVWIVGVSNAFNLVDGLDGLAGTVASIAIVSTGISALLLGRTGMFWYCCALLGAVLGFLRYNLAPARIFLGDCGSLLLGFVLALLTVGGSQPGGGKLLALLPLAALSYPLIDTGVAMLRRWLRGDPLSRADGRHIHHQLQKLGLSHSKAVLVIAVQSTAVAILGLSTSFAPPETTLAVAALGAGLLFCGLVYGVRWLQYHEFLEVGAALRDAGPRARQVLRDRIQARDVAALIKAAPSLDNVNQILSECSDEFRFAYVTARGRSSRRPFADLPPAVQLLQGRSWRVEYPVSTIRDHPASSLLLDIWCSMDHNGNPANAERVAKILATAIESWAEAQPAHPWNQPPAVAASAVRSSHDASADVHLQA